jgi:hypothetical protein
MEPGMNVVVGDRCEIAGENVRAGVNPERRFPRNIFVGEWSDFFFFDSDWMKESDFVEHVKAFLDIERGQCACLWKLDSADANEPRFFFVRRQTTPDDYRALLAGTTPGYGWLDAMERLACASDVGEWCMYCEPNNDIAVIGFRHADAADRYSSAMARVHATRFEDATREPPLSYGFSERALSAQWRDDFLREYATRSL